MYHGRFDIQTGFTKCIGLSPGRTPDLPRRQAKRAFLNLENPSVVSAVAYFGLFLIEVTLLAWTLDGDLTARCGRSVAERMGVIAGQDTSERATQPGRVRGRVTQLYQPVCRPIRPVPWRCP